MSQTGDHAGGLHDHRDCPWCPDEDESAMQVSIAFAAQHLRAVEHIGRDRVVVEAKGWDRLQAAIRRYVEWAGSGETARRDIEANRDVLDALGDD